MSKFKVRRCQDASWYAPIGFETIIFSAGGGGLFFTDIVGQVRPFNPTYWELIEPAHQGPVRTVTTTSKLIEPGEYGRLTVGKMQTSRDSGTQFVPIRVGGTLTEYALMDEAELRTLGLNIIAMADALEPSK